MLVPHGLRKSLRAQASPLKFHFLQLIFTSSTVLSLPETFKLFKSHSELRTIFSSSLVICSIKKYQCRYYLCKIKFENSKTSELIELTKMSSEQVIKSSMVVYAFDTLSNFNQKIQFTNKKTLVNRLNGQPSPPIPADFPTEPYPLFVTWKTSSNG